jgi:hypothetical protein
MYRLRGLARWTGACFFLLACAPDASLDEWPEGAVIAGRSAALGTVLDQIQDLEGTPLARRARVIADRLGDCERVEGQDPEGRLAHAAESIECAPPDSAFASVHAWRGERDLAFALPLEHGARLRGALSVSASGDIDVEVSLPTDAFSGARRLLVPGSKPAGPGVLSGNDRLIHLRVRPDEGLDLASLVPSGGQAEQLFRLKSGLFQGLVLDGTWEAALYVPEPGQPMPPAALALGFTSRRAARMAVDRFLREIETAWPVQRSPFSASGVSGACLLQLRLLPDLAPCYVATDHALVIGWNAASVRKALLGAPGEEGEFAGVASADLDRFVEADTRLASLAGDDGAPPPARWPWRRVIADGERVGDRVQIRVHLESEGGA